MTRSPAAAPVVLAFRGVDIPNYDVITNCMHCGLCLPHCPTFALTGLEKSSPRGRIRLIKAVADGELAITDGFVDEMHFCLDCQACETVCPAGVKYGSLVEAARAQIFQGGHESFRSKSFKRIFLRWFFSDQARLKSLARILRLKDYLGITWLFEKTGLLKLLSKRLHDVQSLSPQISSHFSSDVLPEVISRIAKPEYRVGFLTGCIMDVAFADVNEDTVELLLQHGCEVVIPKGQSCCGSLQAHYGDRQGARQMARRNIEIFDRYSLDYVIMNSAGCGAFMKEYSHVFDDDKNLAERAKRISEKTLDITEFLFMIGLKIPDRPGPFLSSIHGNKISYHDACHLVHTQRVSQQPRALLRSVPGIRFVELPESSWCCGSAGIYNVVRYNDSMKLLDRKVGHVKSIMPDILLTGNPGCQVQIQYGLQKQDLDIKLMHTATFLRRVCETQET
ncbi:MAG: (Fe-S)-binding protein [Ignavibacteriales bacterium]|nr:(Fe-S)-binding protein [Ignavibacteriales bacterium]